MVLPIVMTMDAKNATIYVKNVVKKLPERAGNMGWNIAQITAAAVRKEAGSIFRHPRPYLISTIRPDVLEPKKRYAVKVEAKNEEGKFYWYYVEHGRGPSTKRTKTGRPQPARLTQALEAWAIAEGKDPWAVAWAIGREGTRAKPFVEKGFIKAQPRIDSYIERESRRLIE